MLPAPKSTLVVGAPLEMSLNVSLALDSNPSILTLHIRSLLLKPRGDIRLPTFGTANSKVETFALVASRSREYQRVIEISQPGPIPTTFRRTKGKKDKSISPWVHQSITVQTKSNKLQLNLADVGFVRRGEIMWDRLDGKWERCEMTWVNWVAYVMLVM